MKKSLLLKIILIILLSFNTTTIYAAETSYTLLEPGIFNGQATDGKVTNFNEYASLIFSTLLTIAIALAILRIVLGGFTYITSATVGEKGRGKDMINKALLGLLIILISYIVLKTINPKLVAWEFKVDQLGGGSVPSEGTNPTPSTGQ